MKYRKFGNTGFDVSALSFGCMRLPMIETDGVKTPNADECIPMIGYAIDNGVNYFDTAYGYLGGQSEVILGRALKGGYRQKVRIATKLPIHRMDSEADFDIMLSTSLERLGVGYIDYYLLHGLDRKKIQKIKQFKVLDKLDAALSSSKIKHAGFSFHDDFDCFREVIGMYDNWSMTQIQFNYMCKDFQAGERGLKFAADKGLAVAVMEPCFGGRLVNLIPQAAAVLDGSDKPRSHVQWAFDWVWNYPEVATVLSGMRAMSEVVDNVTYANQSAANEMTGADLRRVDKAASVINARDFVSCTACGYCEPCAQGVDIPGCFAAYNEGGRYGRDAGRSRYNNINKSVRADKCISCGICEEKCPQEIAISKEMPKVAAFMNMI